MRLHQIAFGPPLAALLLALTLSILWAANSPMDDPYSTLNTQWNGTSALVQMGFLPVSADLTDTISSTSPVAVLLVIGPSLEFTELEASVIHDFVRKGNVLFMADSFGSGNTLLKLLELPVRFSSKLLVDPLFYSKQPLYPVILDLSSSDFSAGLSELVLDYATTLNITDREMVRTLAISSPFSFLDIARDGQNSQEDPSGPFPVLAKLRFGEGAIVLFTSPASLANGLINKADNVGLVQNIIARASQSERRAALLFDETHLESSPFTPAKLMAQRFVMAILQRDMHLPGKLSLVAAAIFIVAGRYMHRKPSSEIVEKITSLHTARSVDIGPVLRLHPTWDRRTLEYIASELEASMNWRRLSEGE